MDRRRDREEEKESPNIKSSLLGDAFIPARPLKVTSPYRLRDSNQKIVEVTTMEKSLVNTAFATATVLIMCLKCCVKCKEYY